MKKLHTFEEFSKIKTEEVAAQIKEEQESKRNSSAETFKSILAEFNVTSVEELSEEQTIEFFTKLKGAGVKNVTESAIAVNEGTRSFFGKIDKKGDIQAVYMHYDGYPENMLPIIKKGYSGGKTKNIDAVIKGGDGSGLEADPKKINYYKDGEKPLGGNAGAPRDFIASTKDSGAEFVYLYDERDGKWYMADTYEDDNFKPAFESLVSERLTRGDISRMDGLINKMALKSFYDAAHQIAADLYEDGFEEMDIEEFLCHLLSKQDWSVNEDRSEEIEADTMEMGEVEDLEKKADEVEVMGESKDSQYYADLNVNNVESLYTVAKDSKNAKEFANSIKDMKDMFPDAKHIDFKKVDWEEIYNDVHESVVNEAEVNSDEEFKEYAFTVLKKAFGDEFDETKAQEVVDGILGKVDGDYGSAVGMLTKSLG